MKLLLALMLFMTFFAHAADPEPGSQYLQAAEAGDRRAQYFLADSWLSYGDLNKAEYWAGMMFLNGEPGFIEKNKQKALHWLNLSCLEGFDTGCEEFETLTNG
ncbi:hypothetical protein [Salmonella enterica]|uniref:hypothetical protein n=1 Tax=Salmonella enterica TaxID=28901 RepID=UPI001CADF329|nr:hypothetical protein [Salmonella enterica]MCZ7064879.1 hypothetical protein [Salmonella enterica]HBI4858972.1 sel1 repeat family protein [Salmonella enterica subsp. enterica serovar Pullorum]